MEGTKLLEVNPYFEKVAKERGFWSRNSWKKLQNTVPCTTSRRYPGCQVCLSDSPRHLSDGAYSDAGGIPETGGQCCVEDGELLHSATTKDVEDVYLFAYDLGCKGVTVYRDGSREEQVLSTGSTGKAASKEEEPAVQAKIVPRKRPESIIGETRTMKTGCGTIYITVNEDEHGQLFELFTHMGKAGGCASSQAEAIGRLVRPRAPLEHRTRAIISQLKGITCHQQTWSSGGKITSCSDAIAKALEKYTEKAARPAGTGATDTARRCSSVPVLNAEVR